jgi:hypothetical protein
MGLVTGVNSRQLIHRASSWLQARGWSASQTALRAPDGLPRWRVDAIHRDGQTISVSAATQSGAWEIVCRKVGQLAPGR